MASTSARSITGSRASSAGAFSVRAGVADRVRFEVGDAAAGVGETFDVISTFDVAHDAIVPTTLLRGILGALAPDGIYLMLEMNSADGPADNVSPSAVTPCRADETRLSDPNVRSEMSEHRAVYLQSNDAAANEVLVFARRGDGSLVSTGAIATGGRGTGKPHLASQSSVALTGDSRWVLAVNAGSDDVSLLAIEAEGGLRLADRVPSGGSAPTSVAVSGSLVYVLNNASASIAGFRIDDGRLVAVDGSVRDLSSAGADPAQIAFSRDGLTLAVTERGTDTITTFAVDEDGRAQHRATIGSSGKTPYGFDFTRDGAMIVTEAFGGVVGQAAASSYALTATGIEPVSGSIGDTRSEVCWAVVTDDGRFAFVTNFGDGTISSYSIAGDGALTLRDAVAGSTRLGEKGVRDEAITRDGRYLYAIDADARQIFGWEIGEDGRLAAIGAFDGLPATVAGLAAA